MNEIKYKTLKNGLRIAAEEIPYVRSVSMGVWINVGSRMEEGSIEGISHFIEHMLFKGTTNRNSRKISNDIDYYGGGLNAFTTHDNTCYHVKMPDTHIDRGIEVLADMLRNSLFDKEDIEKEKIVIAEEIKMYEDSPEDYLYEELSKRTYNNQGIGSSVLGTAESIERINREAIVEYFNKYYIPKNSVIVISGNFVFDEIVEKIEENFGSWDGEFTKPKRQGQTFKPVRYIEDREDEQANLAILYPCPSDKIDKDFYSIKLLGNIIGQSPSSRLFQHIREEKGLSYNIYSSDSFYVGCAEFGIYASVALDNLVEVMDLIKAEVEDLRTNYVSEEELRFAKEQYKGSIIMNLEDTEDRMLLIGEYEVTDSRLKEIDDIIEIVEEIDLEYIKGVIDRIFSKEAAIGITGKKVSEIIK